MKLNIITIKAHKSRIHEKRDKKDVLFILVHYTGNKGDTSKNNGVYFARADLPEVKDTNNPRYGVGAHFFIDKKGNIVKSIPMNRVAWSVGGFFTKNNGAGSYYGKCTNANSISIELCDCTKKVSWEQLVALKKLIKYIQKYCPNAKTVIRHWDVNGKTCPAPMTGTNNKKWKRLHNYVTEGYQFKAKVTKKAAIRSSKGVKPKNKIASRNTGDIVYITKIIGNWGRLKCKSSSGSWRWISLKKVKEV